MRPPEREPIWLLPQTVRRLIAALVPVVCPPEPASEQRELGEAICDHVERAVGALDAPVRAALVAGMLAYDMGAVARYGRRAGALDPARGRAYFAAWLRLPGPTHELAKGVKGLIAMAYYEMPQVREALEYRPAQWIAQVDARRRARYADDIERHAASLVAPDPLRPGPAPPAASRVRLRLAREEDD